MGVVRREWAYVLLGTIAVLLALSVGIGTLGVDAGSDAPGLGGDGTTDGADTPAETLGPPDWPSEPLAPSDVPGRDAVENTSEYPYSTIGHVGASGALISDYHVLTAAHVVTEDDGSTTPAEELTFTPGLGVEPDGPVEAPFGRANVVDVYVHPDWDGQPPEDDLALLVLDRPVGAIAGSMALPEAGVADAHQRELQQAGYVHNVTGARQITSRPTPQETVANAEAAGVGDAWSGSSTTEREAGYHYYCAPVSKGDSGSPVWTDVDGTPTILSVNAAFDSAADCEDGAVGVLLDEDRLELVREWMDESERPPARADLAVASADSAISWVDAEDEVPDGPLTPEDAPLPFATTIYNNGPAGVGTTPDRSGVDDRASVRFVGVGTRSDDAGENGTESVVRELCSTRVAVEPYSATQASCTVDELPPALWNATSIDVYATVDVHDRTATYADSPPPVDGGPAFVGSVPVAEN